MEINVGKNEVNRISKLPSPVVLIMIEKKTAECGIFQLFGKNNK